MSIRGNRRARAKERQARAALRWNVVTSLMVTGCAVIPPGYQLEVRPDGVLIDGQFFLVPWPDDRALHIQYVRAEASPRYLDPEIWADQSEAVARYQTLLGDEDGNEKESFEEGAEEGLGAEAAPT